MWPRHRCERHIARCWRFLVASRYFTTLWIPALHRAFPDGRTDLRERRRAVERTLERLTFVRNRAAHHEPIHRRDLLRDGAEAVTLTAWISSDCAAWVAARSPISLAVRSKPSLDEASSASGT